MTDHSSVPDAGSPGPAWRQPLADLERALRDASWALSLLLRSLEGDGRVASPAAREPLPLAAPAPAEDGRSGDRGESSPFERLWDRLELERTEARRAAADASLPRRGLDALPHQYLMTVEDREGKVDLIALHRALLTLAGAEDVSLASFVNGVPVVSMRVVGELDLDRLGETISGAMDRACEVIPQDTGRLYLRLQSRQEE